MPVAVADIGNAYMLAVLVANSSTFRTVVGATDITTALAKIYYPWANEDEQEGALELPSRAVIVDDSDFGEEIHTKTATGTWKISGSFRLNLDFNIPTAERIGKANEYAWFNQQCREIFKEMRAIAGWGSSGVGNRSQLNMMNYRREEGPWEIAPGEQELPDPTDGPLVSYWHCGYEVFYW